MKLAPLVKALEEDEEFHPVLVHTGQHYDDKMSGQFFRDLGMPEPDHYLGVGSGSHAKQTAAIMQSVEPVIIDEAPDAVVVVGDVNSTMACAIVAAKLQVPVIHVEAGLRSLDRSMPEEINRVLTDSISDVLLITEESGRRNLLHEGIHEERIHLIGNLMIDSLRKNQKRAASSDVLEKLGLSPKQYGVITLHRPANVDSAEQLTEILEALVEISRTVPLYFPVHPRTKARLTDVGLPPDSRIHLIEPFGYLDFLHLMSQSAIMLTDSGGIQEETTVLGVPCLTLRENTERPVTIEQGTNTLAGTSRQTILNAWQELRATPKDGRIPPMWDGKAAERALKVIRKFFAKADRAE